MDAVGQRVRRLRLQRGWSLKDAAEACGLSHEALRRIERGAQPRPQTLQAIARGFNVTVSDLIDDRDEPLTESERHLVAQIRRLRPHQRLLVQSFVEELASVV